MKKTKEQKIERKLSVVRRTSYICLALVIFELSGIFALAGPKGLYVVTKPAANAFYPKKYVDVEIHEPNGQDYVIQDNNAVAVGDDGKVILDDENKPKGKVASVKNAFGSKKDALLRARIVAEVYDETNQVYNEALTKADYTISVSGNDDYNITDKGNWFLHTDGYYYYTSILKIGEETTNLFDNVTLTDSGLSKIPEGGYVEFNVIIDSLDAGILDTENTLQNKCWNNVPDTILLLWKDQRGENSGNG